MAYVHDKHEEVVADRARAPTVDWESYPTLTFPEVPAPEFALIQRRDQPRAGEVASKWACACAPSLSAPTA